MAANQTGRLLAILVAEAGAILVLLFAAAGFAAPGALLTLGTGLMVLVALVGLARFQLASQCAGYIESHLLARVGNDTPAAAAGDFAKTAGKAAAESMTALAGAQAKFVDQLAKSQEQAPALASSIDNVLKLQQAVDGTLKGVTVTDEFKSTLVELKRHLAESDQLLKNAAKPRTIRLVEKDNE